MTFNPGDDVWIDFEGQDHAGTVLKDEAGWVRAEMLVDSEWDYGGGGEKMAPMQTVAVRNCRVRVRDE